MEQLEPKKRGRKKKVLTVPPTENSEIPIENTEIPVKILNKRGRKAKVVDFKKNQDVKLSNFNLQETYILHLPISLDQLLKDIPKQLGIEHILSQKPKTLIPLDISNSNSICNSMSNYTSSATKDVIPSKSDGINTTNKKETVQTYKSVDKYGNSDIIKVYDSPILPVDLDYENVKQILTVKTNIACWWCCHQFDTYPVCCPVKYNQKEDLFSVVGCFCSFNCAKAYSNKEYNSKYSMISFLYKKIQSEFKNIKEAPTKTVLKMFGGPLTIEEYRDTFDTLSSVTINKYPMIFVPTQVEYHKVNDMIKASIDRISASKSKTTNISKKNVDNASKRLSISKDKKTENINLMNIMGITVKK